MSHNFQMGYSVEKENYADNVDKKKHKLQFVNHTVIVVTSGCEHQDWNHLYRNHLYIHLI